MSAPRPALSIVIPARDAAATMARCLDAVARSAAGMAELVVVDDGSTDATGDIARAAGARVLRHHTSAGPAAARNSGARAAAADLVLFLDADVAVAGNAIPRVLAAFAGDPDLVAVFGSYDDTPAAPALVSQYRNLLHHFIHQTSRENTASFWAGCGAVRTDVFLRMGGFDERYHRASIEDVEFGDRLARSNHRVRLDRHLLGTHLKRWTLWSLIVTDVRDRAYPWSRLVLARGSVTTDLNLRPAHRVSAALVWLGALSTLALATGRPLVSPDLLLGTIVATATAVVVLNRNFYGFLAQHRGLRFTAGAIVLHALYYGYASATFAWCWLGHQCRRVAELGRRGDRPGPAANASLRRPLF